MVQPIKVTIGQRLKGAIAGFSFRGGSREFYPGGGNSQRRFSRAQMASDIAEMMSQHRHRMLLGDARYIYQASSTVSGSVLQKSNYVYGSAWKLKSHSADKDFAKAVEEDFDLIDRRLDIRGDAFSFRRNIKIACKALDVDGDFLVVLTEDKKTGFPLLQYLESHKIGDWGKVEQGVIKEGKFKGRRIYTGVIVDDVMRPIAYRVKDESLKSGFRDIMANNVVFVCDLEWFTQARGVPSITAGILDWYDLAETKDAQKVKQKINSILTLVESNQTGKRDVGKSTLGIGNSSSGIASEYIDSGLVRVIKNGGSLNPHTAKDPPKEWLDFMNTVETSALLAMGWRREMLDSSKIGGAGVRGFAADINKSVQNRVEVLYTMQKRLALYIIAKRAKQGVYNLPDDWYKFSFTAPAEFTVDEGRMRQQDREDLRAGLTTETSIVQRKGVDFTENLRQRAKEVVERKKVAEEFGIDPSELGTLAMPGDPVDPDEE
jgi:capsid protein